MGCLSFLSVGSMDMSGFRVSQMRQPLGTPHLSRDCEEDLGGPTGPLSAFRGIIVNELYYIVS